MLETGDDILLHVDRDGPGTPGAVVACHANGWSVEFEVEDFAPEVGRNAVLRFDVGGRFTEQSVRIESVEVVGFSTTVRLAPIEAPASAECRRHPRISTVNSEAMIRFGAEDQCPLLDVSVAGLSVMAGEAYAEGDTVTVTVERDGAPVTWTVVVRSVREIWEGRFRYGLECEHADVDPTELLDRLNATS